MSNYDIVMKKGDRLPSITFTCVPPAGTDISGASGVVFQFQPVASLGTGAGIISGACVIISAAPTALVVRYDWGASDTIAAGDFDAEFVVTVGGKKMTFPNDDPAGSQPYLKLHIWGNVS